MKRIIEIFLFSAAGLFTACSGSDYLNSVPRESTALIAVDVPKLAESTTTDGEKSKTFLQSLLGIKDVTDCGIDLTSKMYLFVSPDGNLGLCAKVSDKTDLEDLFKAQQKCGNCTPITEKKGFRFTVLKDAWIVGFSKNALLVMGPVVAEAKAELQRQMVKYLDAEEENGIKASPLYDRLEAMQSSVAMVAQAQALPEKFVAPFTLGAPKDADASQICLAAEMRVQKDCLQITGEAFSLNSSIDKALKGAAQSYRPIQGQYIKCMSEDAVMGLFMNADGHRLLDLLRSNKSLQLMLAGINAAVDMDKIIRSIDGDVAFIIPAYRENELQMMMGAQLAKRDFLSDVTYWKKSVPTGSRITDEGKDAYRFTDGTTNFYFGVSADNQFYAGSSAERANAVLHPSCRPMPSTLLNEMKGQKMCMILNLDALRKSNETVKTALSLLTPLFGDVHAVVYRLK